MSKLGTATEIPRTIDILSSQEIEGTLVIETSCPDYEAYIHLPVFVSYLGRELGKTGWNSDTGRACYKTRAFLVARAL